MDGRKKKMLNFKLSDLRIDEEITKCLIGMHAFTGNDYNSSFFHRGKAKCLQVMKNNQEFMSLFEKLDDTLDLEEVEALLPSVEHYVCRSYSSKFKYIVSFSSCR